MKSLYSHPLLSMLAVQLLIAAIVALPEDGFQFYPWLRHTLKLWLNAVPQQYRTAPPAAAPMSADSKEP